MLYEVVTGRPPFLGDESVAIIGQHLNTAPVAPSWHRPDCPPGLEALILRLLEKRPAQRPASADEVRAALAAVASSGPATTLEAADAGTAARVIYQRTFVGREAELDQLTAAFDRALSGEGAVAMVVGEPGIGKTTLTEQLATYVALRGGRALWGHCYEEGSLALPYLAFVEALRSYVLERDAEALRSELGTGAGEVARIVSEVRDRVQVSPAEGRRARGAALPADDRGHDVPAQRLRGAAAARGARRHLHDADRGTLDLLLHVARSLQGARLLVVGSYRDVEVNRAHPLSGTLAELRRAHAFIRVPLRGLSPDEVHRMMSNIRGQEESRTRAEAVWRQTEGNPLFVQEVLRYLVESGLVVREGDRYVRTDAGEAPEAGIPEGLRDVIGKRLTRLSPETNAILAIAAVQGRDFRLDVLQAVTHQPAEAVEAALEEAAERAIVEERTGLGALAFRFTHAFFRQTLYEELFAARRLRLHQEVGRALEAAYGRRADETHAGGARRALRPVHRPRRPRTRVALRGSCGRARARRLRLQRRRPRAGKGHRSTGGYRLRQRSKVLRSAPPAW